MSSIPTNIYSTVVVFGLLLVPGKIPKSVHANELQGHALQDGVTSNSNSLSLDNDLLDIRLENVPLKQVLEELRKQLPVEFTFLDPKIGHQTINADIQNKPLKHVLKIILDGYSYVLNNKKGLSTVYILSKASKPYFGRFSSATKSPSLEKTRKPHYYEVGLSENDQANDSLESNTATIGKPTGNSDYTPCGNAFGFTGSLESGQESSQHIFEEALQSIESGCLEHQGEALEQLVGQDDERATRALIEAALSSSSDDIGLATDATDALARHAAEFEYRDQEVVSALQSLAQKDEKAIKETAQHALREMERFQQLLSESALE